MAESEDQKPEIKIDDPPPSDKSPRPSRRRKFSFDKEKAANYIWECINSDLDERNDRIQRRKARRAKLMGWNGPQDWPWEDASNVFLPIMLIANLKTRGTLENSLKSISPLMEAKARQRRNQGKEEAINRILDYQFFAENRGNSTIDNFVGNFVSDEAAYLFAQWVKETQSYHDVRLLPGLDPAVDHSLQILLHLKDMYPSQLSTQMTDEAGWEWKVIYEDDEKQQKIAAISFYETDDNKLEAHIVVDMTTHNGPCVSVEDFEDIVFPARAENLQPPSSANPRGAPYFARLVSVNLDTIRRRMDDHTYDQMTEKDWEKVEGSPSTAASGDKSDEEKEQKDRMEGAEINYSSKREDREQAVWFGRLDVNGDGLEEDVIVWLFMKSKVIAKLAMLTEIYPGVPIRRPIAHEAFIPITNRICGISQDELLESLQDAMQTCMDQHMNWGEITNTPMFFYRASSGMKNEPIYIEPGVGYPLDDPQQDVNFPVWPTKDSSYAINTISLLQQFVERIQMFSDVSVGRVPQGKASALRTASTTMSLLAQGDLRSEQVLRRMFTAFSDIFSIMHRLNRRFLPDQKEIRIIGKGEQGEEAYTTINRNDLDADIDFEFKATLINTNKQTLSASLDKIIAMAITPFAMQAGLIDLDTMYTLLRDATKALDLDPDKYWKRPPQQMQGPALLAEEVISLIKANEIPKGKPLENPEEHVQKLAAFMQSDQFGFLNETQAVILKEWIIAIAQRMAQQQALMQAMAQFQQSNGGGQGQLPGPPGTPGATGTAANPQTQGDNLIDQSIGQVQ